MSAISETITAVRLWFWDPDFWLPPNTNWTVLDRPADSGIYYPDFYDLWIPFPTALALLLVRLIWERYVATPIGRYFKVSNTLPRRAVPNEILEQAFRKNRKLLPHHSVIAGLSKQLDWSARQVERWWRRRRVQGKPSEMKRFRETSWRFLFYIISFWTGLYVLWDKPWLWDTKHCWYNYPLHPMTTDLYWYYMLEMSFYWSLVFSLCVDVKRKDFVENVVHHIVTLSLMVVSWTGNMTRVGTLVLCVHDAVDYILELAKLAKYCKMEKCCNVLFVLFTVVWLLTRILFFPIRILYSTLFEGHVIIGFANIYYAYNGLLIALQILHIIWFYMILRMVYSFIFTGTNEKDTRSESETATNSEDDFVSYKPQPVVMGHETTDNCLHDNDSSAATCNNNSSSVTTATNGSLVNKRHIESRHD